MQCYLPLLVPTRSLRPEYQGLKSSLEVARSNDAIRTGLKDETPPAVLEPADIPAMRRPEGYRRQTDKLVDIEATSSEHSITAFDAPQLSNYS